MKQDTLSMATTTQLTPEDIKTVIEGLPLQHRIMLRLLLLQYLDLSEEDFAYMAQDQPDSRFQSGTQPAQKISSTEGIRDIKARAEQYRLFLREKREKPWLEVKCLKHQLSVTQQAISKAQELLQSRFGVDETTIEEKRKHALSAIPKPDIRRLEQAWEQGSISEDDYKTDRLLIEFQTLIRRAERLRRRLAVTKRDLHSSQSAPLQDHEIAHIWGIPLSSLAARKVKALHQFLTNLQAIAENRSPSGSTVNDTGSQPTNFWHETFSILSKQHVEQSMQSYVGGIEPSEEVLMDKLKAFTLGELPDNMETQFWQAVTRLNDTEHGGAWSNYARSIFTLQRLVMIQEELEPTPSDLEQQLLARCTPKSLADALPAEESDEEPVELNEVALGVLTKFMGEQDDKRRA